MAKLMAMLFEAANKPEMESVLHAVFPRLLQRSLKLLCDAEVRATALCLLLFCCLVGALLMLACANSPPRGPEMTSVDNPSAATA